MARIEPPEELNPPPVEPPNLVELPELPPEEPTEEPPEPTEPPIDFGGIDDAIQDLFPPTPEQIPPIDFGEPDEDFLVEPTFPITEEQYTERVVSSFLNVLRETVPNAGEVTLTPIKTPEGEDSFELTLGSREADDTFFALSEGERRAVFEEAERRVRDPIEQALQRLSEREYVDYLDNYFGQVPGRPTDFEPNLVQRLLGGTEWSIARNFWKQEMDRVKTEKNRAQIESLGRPFEFLGTAISESVLADAAAFVRGSVGDAFDALGTKLDEMRDAIPESTVLIGSIKEDPIGLLQAGADAVIGILALDIWSRTRLERDPDTGEANPFYAPDDPYGKLTPIQVAGVAAAHGSGTALFDSDARSKVAQAILGGMSEREAVEKYGNHLADIAAGFVDPLFLLDWGNVTYKLFKAAPILKRFIPETRLLSDINETAKALERGTDVYGRPIAYFEAGSPEELKALSGLNQPTLSTRATERVDSVHVLVNNVVLKPTDGAEELTILLRAAKENGDLYEQLVGKAVARNTFMGSNLPDVMRNVNIDRLGNYARWWGDDASYEAWRTDRITRIADAEVALRDARAVGDTRAVAAAHRTLNSIKLETVFYSEADRISVYDEALSNTLSAVTRVLKNRYGLGATDWEKIQTVNAVLKRAQSFLYLNNPVFVMHNIIGQVVPWVLDQGLSSTKELVRDLTRRGLNIEKTLVARFTDPGAFGVQVVLERELREPTRNGVEQLWRLAQKLASRRGLVSLEPMRNIGATLERAHRSAIWESVAKQTFRRTSRVADQGGVFSSADPSLPPEMRRDIEELLKLPNAQQRLREYHQTVVGRGRLPVHVGSLYSMDNYHVPPLYRSLIDNELKDIPDATTLSREASRVRQSMTRRLQDSMANVNLPPKWFDMLGREYAWASQQLRGRYSQSDLSDLFTVVSLDSLLRQSEEVSWIAHAWAERGIPITRGRLREWTERYDDLLTATRTAGTREQTEAAVQAVARIYEELGANPQMARSAALTKVSYRDVQRKLIDDLARNSISDTDFMRQSRIAYQRYALEWETLLSASMPHLADGRYAPSANAAMGHIVDVWHSTQYLRGLEVEGRTAWASWQASTDVLQARAFTEPLLKQIETWDSEFPRMRFLMDQTAEGAVNFAMLNYRTGQVKADVLAQLVFPWEFWPTRMAHNWTWRMVEHPWVGPQSQRMFEEQANIGEILDNGMRGRGWSAGLAELEAKIEMNKRELPEGMIRFMKIPLPFIKEDGRWGNAFASPINKYLIPYYVGDEYTDWDLANKYGRGTAELIGALPGFSPLLQYGAKATGLYGPNAQKNPIPPTPWERFVTQSTAVATKTSGLHLRQFITDALNTLPGVRVGDEWIYQPSLLNGIERKTVSRLERLGLTTEAARARFAEIAGAGFSNLHAGLRDKNADIHPFLRASIDEQQYQMNARYIGSGATPLGPIYITAKTDSEYFQRREALADAAKEGKLEEWLEENQPYISTALRDRVQKSTPQEVEGLVRQLHVQDDLNKLDDDYSVRFAGAVSVSDVKQLERAKTHDEDVLFEQYGITRSDFYKVRTDYSKEDNVGWLRRFDAGEFTGKTRTEEELDQTFREAADRWHSHVLRSVSDNYYGVYDYYKDTVTGYTNFKAARWAQDAFIDRQSIISPTELREYVASKPDTPEQAILKQYQDRVLDVYYEFRDRGLSHKEAVSRIPTVTPDDLVTGARKYEWRGEQRFSDDELTSAMGHLELDDLEHYFSIEGYRKAQAVVDGTGSAYMKNGHLVDTPTKAQSLLKAVDDFERREGLVDQREHLFESRELLRRELSAETGPVFAPGSSARRTSIVNDARYAQISNDIDRLTASIKWTPDMVKWFGKDGRGVEDMQAEERTAAGWSERVPGWVPNYWSYNPPETAQIPSIGAAPPPPAKAVKVPTPTPITQSWETVEGLAYPTRSDPRMSMISGALYDLDVTDEDYTKKRQAVLEGFGVTMQDVDTYRKYNDTPTQMLNAKFYELVVSPANRVWGLVKDLGDKFLRDQVTQVSSDKSTLMAAVLGDPVYSARGATLEMLEAAWGNNPDNTMTLAQWWRAKETPEVQQLMALRDTLFEPAKGTTPATSESDKRRRVAEYLTLQINVLKSQDKDPITLYDGTPKLVKDILSGRMEIPDVPVRGRPSGGAGGRGAGGGGGGAARESFALGGESETIEAYKRRLQSATTERARSLLMTIIRLLRQGQPPVFPSFVGASGQFLRFARTRQSIISRQRFGS